MRRILLSNTLNTRDLGGYPIDHKKSTMYKAFLRSDVPHQVTAEDLELLLTKGITTIIDLRNDHEVEHKPCALKDKEAFDYYHCKIFGDGRLPESPEAVPYSYLEIVDEQVSVLGVMQVLARANGGALFHCTAGKDRTGVISALLLLLAGVQNVDIIADYQLSQAYLWKMLQQYSRNNHNVDLNIITPKAEYMDTFLKLFLGKYQSVEQYLSQISLSDIEIAQLKGKLVTYRQQPIQSLHP